MLCFSLRSLCYNFLPQVILTLAVLINKGAFYNISQSYVVLLCQLWLLLLTAHEFFSILEIKGEEIVSIFRIYEFC